LFRTCRSLKFFFGIKKGFIPFLTQIEQLSKKGNGIELFKQKLFKNWLFDVLVCTVQLNVDFEKCQKYRMHDYSLAVVGPELRFS